MNSSPLEMIILVVELKNQELNAFRYLIFLSLPAD